MSKENLGKIKSILAWAFGVLLGISGIGLLFSEPVPALGLLVMSAVLIPPILKWVEKKMNFKLSTTVKIIILAIGLLLVGFTVQTPEDTDKEESENVKPEEAIETEVNTNNEEGEPEELVIGNYVISSMCQEKCSADFAELPLEGMKHFDFGACHILCEEERLRESGNQEDESASVEGDQDEMSEAEIEEEEPTEKQVDVEEGETTMEDDALEPSSTQTTSSSESTAAYKIASLEDGFNPPTDSTLAQFETLLASLEKKCPNESQDEIAGYVFVAQEKFTEKGMLMSYLEVAKGIDGSMPEGMNLGVSCAEVAAAFVTLATGQ